MRTLLLAPALLVSVLLCAAAAEDCMPANEKGMIAEGRLELRGDAYILKLPQPICLKGEVDSDNVAGSSEIHVYSFDESVQSSLRKLVGKDVHVEGTMMGAITQHHKAPIVMEATEADAI
jgi:Domain of unknown function (DUF4431)